MSSGPARGFATAGSSRRVPAAQAAGTFDWLPSQTLRRLLPFERIYPPLPGGKTARVPTRAKATPGARLTLGIRPEHLSIAGQGSIAGEIMVVERLGGHTYVYVQIAPGHLVIVEADGEDSHRLHERVWLSFRPADCHLFDDKGLALQRLDTGPSHTNASATH